MTDLFQQILDWVALHPYWSGVLIFLVAMAESLAIVGLMVPGVVIMFGIGALIAAGSIDFWPAMISAVAGAVLGDGLSFWLGRHYREDLRGIWPFTRYPEALSQGVAFFEKYGGKSVAFGRFFGPVRAMIPLVAGMMGMRPWRFFIANLLSALAWAPAYLLPGMVFGASLELASEVAFRLVILILLLAAVIWLVIWLTHRIFLLLHPHASSLVQGMLRWSRLHPRAGKIAAALADPGHPEAKGLSILASLLILAMGLFALVLGAVLEGTALAGIDQIVFQGLQSLRTPWADHLMLYFSRLADPNVSYALILGVLLLLVARRHHRTALHWLAAASFCLLAAPLLKMGLQIARPPVIPQPYASYAFPSGHVLKAVVLFGFLSVIAARTIPPRWRWIPYSIAGLLTAAVALSRLYLGSHWLSDVLGSITLGLAWISALGIAYHRHTDVESHWRPLSLAAATLLLIAVAVESGLSHQRQLQLHTPNIAVSEMAADQWWRSAWQELPSQRNDTRNKQQHPLNLQYAGSLMWLKGRLSESGWRSATVLSWNSLLMLLSPSLSLPELPVLPQVHDGRHDQLVLEKILAGDRRLVLRLWSTDVRLRPGQEPLWLGSVSEQNQVRILGLLTFAETAKAFRPAFEALLQDTAALDTNQRRRKGDLLLIRE